MTTRACAYTVPQIERYDMLAVLRRVESALNLAGDHMDDDRIHGAYRDLHVLIEKVESTGPGAA